MKSDIESEIGAYLRAIKIAGNEEVKRQRLVSLLQSLFGHMDQAKPILEEFVAGAEKFISRIERVGKKSDRGRADTQYRSVIIEFENDLSKTGGHAKDQLADYLCGNWNSGSTYNFTLITSDCVTWKIFTPNIDEIPVGQRISANNIQLTEKQTFTLKETNLIDFYYFLDSLLFQVEKKQPTLSSIQSDFGIGSNAFITAIDQLTTYFDEVRDQGEVAVAYQQWERFLSIAYDTFDSSERIFLIHTYLSVFAKMLTYEVLTKDDFIDDSELTGIITGEIFESLNIRNFVDNDFFHWIGNEHALRFLRPMFRAISSELNAYNFDQIDEDIMKGVYQEFIDRDTRHSLGEYYTPDWLCEMIVDSLELKKNSRILDPSCGSGSFLRASIAAFERDFPELTADQIAAQVSGLDIHPLSVQIAKTTVLISLKEKITEAPQPVFLSVYLANTLLSPTGSASLDFFGDTFDVWIDNKQVKLNTKIFDDPMKFEQGVHFAEKLAELTLGQPDLNFSKFSAALNADLAVKQNEIFLLSIHEIYKALKWAKESERDSIWEFIILNLYKPCFFKGCFDYVLGNPPWFTFASIRNTSYQELLRSKAKQTGTWSSKQANAPHMEIATIFLAHSVEYFLKEKGRLAFVLPRGIFQADHHDNIRRGAARYVRIKEIWDLDRVTPLFNVPACVLFVERAHGSINTAIPKSGCEGKIISGSLKKHNANLDEVGGLISTASKTFYYSKLGNSSAFTTKKISGASQANYYKKLFRQGATLVPRNFYFIEPDQDLTGDLSKRTFRAKTSKASVEQAKKPWKSITMQGRISGAYLFRTAISQNILPFALHAPPLVVLPAKFNDAKRLELLSPNDLIADGALDTAAWFKKVEALWDENKTERNASTSNIDWLNFGGKLTKQEFDQPFVVIYTSSAKDASATVIPRGDIDLPFIVDHKAYMFPTQSEHEGHFLSAFLNSGYANEMIKDFQTRGLFGPRDIHKTILEVPLPRFDPAEPNHLKISQIGKACATKASSQIAYEGTETVLSAHALGRLRLKLRSNLHTELKKIDKLLRII